MADTNNTTYAYLLEAVPGVINATPVWKNVEYIPGTDLTFDYKTLTSDTLRKNRALRGVRNINGEGGGSLKLEARLDEFNTDCLMSVMGATRTGSDMKAGNAVNQTLAFERRVQETSGFSHFRSVGEKCIKSTFAVDAAGKATFVHEFKGSNYIVSSTPLTGATYVDTTKGAELTAVDIKSITIGTMVADYQSLEWSIEQGAEATFKLGAAVSRGVNHQDKRMAKVTVKLYRDGLAPETMFAAGARVPVSFEATYDGKGYRVSMPTSWVIWPKSEANGSSEMVTMELWAVQDDVTGTDLTVTIVS